MKETKPDRSPQALARLVSQRYKEIPKGVRQMAFALLIFGGIALLASKK